MYIITIYQERKDPNVAQYIFQFKITEVGAELNKRKNLRKETEIRKS